MKPWIKNTLVILLVPILLVVFGPFLIPVPPLQGLKPPRELADPDSRFISVDGIEIHFKEMGAGETTFLLLHGFGASVFSWREVMDDFAAYGRVIAFDRPGYGLSQRLLPGDWSGENPYTAESQARQIVRLMDVMGVEKAILVGNSAGGTMSVFTYLSHPDRVEALILLDPAIYSGGGAPAFVRPLLGTPQMRHVGPLISRTLVSDPSGLLDLAWHDPSRVTPDILAGYAKAYQVENWDKALWEFTLASRELGLDARLGEIRLPTLVVTGDDDRIVPTEESIRLASEIPAADLVVLPACGHVPQEECPQGVMEAVAQFLTRLETR